MTGQSLRKSYRLTATDHGIIGRGLEAAAHVLGALHVCEEGPNAGWVGTSESAMRYEEDLRCRPDCPVCHAEQQVQAARVALGGA